MRTSNFVVSLLATAAIVSAQQACPPICLGNGVNFPFPPVTVVSSVTPGAHAPGACPNGWCTFNFTVDVTVTSPAGETFQVCFVPPVPALCVPYIIPVDPAKPAVTQTMSQAFTLGVQCGHMQEIDLQMNQLLGPVNIVTIDMTCGGC